MTRNLLVLGRFGRQEREQLSLVAIESGHQLTLVDQVSAAAEYLENAVPHAILIDTRLSQSETFGLSVRAQSAHALTPVLGLVEEATDLAFADTFSWGGDDVVDLRSERSLLSRLRRLPHEHAVPASAHRGVAVVADPDRDRRLVRARVLRNAGYQIQFAVSADELSQGVENSPTLIVVDEELDGIAMAFRAGAQLGEVAEDLLDVLDTGRPARGPRNLHPLPARQVGERIALQLLQPALVMAAPRHLGRLNARLSTRHNAVAADGFAPPENLIFLANELSRGGSSDKRSSKRLLYGTRVVFRGEGREEEDVGYSYNLSSAGLYVRTLALPDDNRVWLELRPPRSDRLVRLEGEVVWRRPFGPSGFATVPPGFGVRIVDATQSNRAAWDAGYVAFAAALEASWSKPPR